MVYFLTAILDIVSPCWFVVAMELCYWLHLSISEKKLEDIANRGVQILLYCITEYRLVNFEWTLADSNR